MNATVHFQRQTEADLRAWVEQMSTREPGGALMAGFLLEEMQRRLAELGDRMPGVVPDRTRDPVELWWEFQPHFWISYVHRYEGWFWRRRLRIIIVSVGEDPPGRVASSSPRG